MRTRRHPYKWQRQRQERAARLKRVEQIRKEIARTNWLIGRLDPKTEHATIRRLRTQLRTLEQRARYINVDEI
jgi:hypothetical protein